MIYQPTTTLQPCLRPFQQDIPKNFAAAPRVDQKTILLDYIRLNPDCTGAAIRKGTGIEDYNLQYFLRTILASADCPIEKTPVTHKAHGDLSNFTYRMIPK